MHESDLDFIKHRVAVCDYLSAAQIYLRDNFTLSRPLNAADIKPRLLGHWGTCHGINIVYTNTRHLPGFQFILGPGHGFPALQANLFIDGELAKIDPSATLDDAGIAYICRQFSWPGGFPSHSSPITPGVITEGGELGYALATAYGAALNRPEKTIVTLIGDGELETATALASLNLPKLISGKNNGKVIPVLHLNGYKISGPTIYGRKSERELLQLFRGFGYRPFIIDGDAPADFRSALDSALAVPHPFLILKTPKGMTGPDFVGDKKISGNYLAHQVPLANTKTDPAELQLLSSWLRSYNFNQLFSQVIKPSAVSDNFTKPPSTPLTSSRHALPPLNLPIIDTVIAPGSESFSSAKAVGACLRAEMSVNPDFYLFSPDETTSNKIDAVYAVAKRAWNLPTKPFDLPSGENGKIIELLSENALFSCYSGHLMTGGTGLMASYEAFFMTIASQLLQHIKFINQSESVAWRKPIRAVNLLSTSTCWRQDHNGYSHQSPALISTLLNIPSGQVNCLFPVDDVAAVAAYQYCRDSVNVVNLTTLNKTDEPRWIDSAHAHYQLQNGGASIFAFASDLDCAVNERSGNYVFTAAGDIVTRETLYAMQILRQDMPNLKMRFVGIGSLTYGAIGTKTRKLSQSEFDQYFGQQSLVIANFHGYARDLETILANYTIKTRLKVHGFSEVGSTTTPFEMLALNHASRYDLAITVAEAEGRFDLVDRYRAILAENHAHALEFGIDIPHIEAFKGCLLVDGSDI